MNVNAQQGLVSGMSVVLAPLRAAAKSEQHLRDLAGLVGWDLDRIAGLPIGELTERLRELADAVDVLIAGLEHPPETLPDLARSLDAAQRAFDAARGLSAVIAAGGGPSHFEDFGRDLIELSITSYLQFTQPLVYHLAVLLTLIEPADEAGMSAAVFDAQGNLVRFPHSRPRLHLDRLGDLITDPGETLRSEYVGRGGMVTPADARRTADKLFPRIAALMAVLGIDAVYGTKSMYGIDLADPQELTGGMLTFWVTPATSELGLGATLSLSPKQRGDLGLVISPFGDVRLSGFARGWEVAVELSAGIDAVAVGPRGVQLLPTAGSTAARFAALAVARGGSATEPTALLVGSTTGSRLELGNVAITAAMTLSEAERAFVVELDIPSAALVVAPSDGDGFLSAILPRDGLRADFRLGVGWSSESGLTFRGSAGLETHVPVGVALGPLTVESAYLAVRAADAGLVAITAATVGVRIGPVQATVQRVGLEAAISFDDGNLGPGDLAIGFKTPDGIALAVDAGVVSGGGFLRFDPVKAEYSGRMALAFEGIALEATGLLSTRLPGGGRGFSLLVIVSARFAPVQLGLGFSLVGVGGVLAIHRTVAVEALRAALKSGGLGAVLSPPDPAADASAALASLQTFFPPAAGRHVFGPTARIVWGAPVLLTIDVCLVLELPAPVRLVVLGRLRAVLPDEREPVVVLQMDLLGVIEFDRREAAVDATLVDSRLASFALTGDMAMRMSWGDAPSFLLAVGGFHPRFAAPAGFPALERVAVSLATGKNPRLRLEAYLALTSNTVQLGARVDLSARSGRFEVAGFLSFDALVQLRPLAFEIDIAAKLAVRAGGRTLLSVSLALTLSGPAPWRARGRASFSILFFDVSFSFDVTIGADAPPALPSAVDVAALLLGALRDPRAWSAVLPAGRDMLVTLRAPSAPAGLLAHPLGLLQVRQRVAPLEQTLQRFGSDAVSGAKRFAISAATLNGQVTLKPTPLEDLFAPAQYSNLTDEQRLSAASFVAMRSGVTLGQQAPTHGAPTTAAITYEQHTITTAGSPQPPPTKVTLPQDILQTLTTNVAITAPRYAVRGS